jgi:acetyl-CoA synthetase
MNQFGSAAPRLAADARAAEQSRLSLARSTLKALAGCEALTIDLDWFWRAVMDDLGIEFTSRTVASSIRRRPGTHGGASHCMNTSNRPDNGWALQPSIARRSVGRRRGHDRELTYGELLRDVNRAGKGWCALGISRGDRVALPMPMCPELIAAFFAVIRLATCSRFSGYGADAVTTRFRTRAQSR